MTRRRPSYRWWVFVLMLAGSPAGVPMPAGAAIVPHPMVEVAPGIYVRQGVQEDATPQNDDGIANIGFIIGSAAVAVIDPGGSQDDGERLRASIIEVTDKPIRYVIMTHAHPDHIFGASAFETDDPDFVGHARMVGAITQRAPYYRRRLVEILGADRPGQCVMPTGLVEDTRELDL